MFQLQPRPAPHPSQRAAASIPADTLYEHALTNAAMSFHGAAIETLQDVTAMAPQDRDAWATLAALLPLAGLDEEARAAAAQGVGGVAFRVRALGERSPARIDKAERKLHTQLRKLPRGEEPAALRDQLMRDPLDVAAMRILAQFEWRDKDMMTARHLFERALQLSPAYMAARSDYGQFLREARSFASAAAEAARLLASAPRHPTYRELRADSLAQIGQFDEAIALFEAMVKDQPRNARYWLAYGHALRSTGKRQEAVQAFRTCLAIAPAMGAAYWGLAELKGAHLNEADVTALRALLASADLDLPSRWHAAYALGHALERAGDYAGSFAAYQDGARAFREEARRNNDAYDPKLAADRVRRTKAAFPAEVFARRAAREAGHDETPIFIVGMPRAGSTLVEQILSSHSLVEGTRELPVMGDITRALMVSRAMVTPLAYPDCVRDLSDEALEALGARYLEGTRPFRLSGRRVFIDKRPWNWLDVGLIHLILPQAKIIDVRRAPMAACFAMFKQALPDDAAFSYDLAATGRYYRDYESLMAHWDAVLPGRVLAVSYERLVEDTEAEIRRMLEYCGLEFEESCLRFWDNNRAVVTPSAEQVRRPIFRDALEQWRHFEPYLGELRDALGA